MPLPEINFKVVREHNGNRHKGFEELCCQLAALEDRPFGATHYRKGPGADAGVECFTRFPDGSETGWQVKYYWEVDSSLMASLDKSIETALTKHPNLKNYVVCIPFDPSDSRSGKSKGPLQKWQAWRDGWINYAKVQGRPLSIDLWNASIITNRLVSGGVLHAGRILYWFSEQPLTKEWFQQKFATTKADLGSRYTAETSITLPIRQALLAFARDPGLHVEVETWERDIAQAGNKAIMEASALSKYVEVISPAGLEEALVNVDSALSAMPTSVHARVPVQEWLASLQLAEHSAQTVLQWCLAQPLTSVDSGGRAYDAARHSLWKLEEVLASVRSDLESNRWALVNSQNVLVTGDGGVGKSHLLADVTAYQIDRGRPAVMLLGQKFIEGNPWQQLITDLDLPAGTNTDHFLGAMDAAAQAVGVRGLILIDALNERHGVDLWPDRLAGFLHHFERFPNLGVILSCRTTYVPHVIPDTLTEDNLPRLDHRGFNNQDTRAYLTTRGFALPSMPIPAQELENPLFLKTCCDSLEKRGQHEFPKGLQGTTATFTFYLGAVADGINRHLHLDPRRRIIECAVDTLAKAMAEGQKEYLPVAEVQRLFDNLLPSQAQYDRDILTQLESEGLLTVETFRTDEGEIEEEVRFTFQRISDHAIASHLIEVHLNVNDPKSAFTDGAPLNRFVTSPLCWEMAGVIEAMAVQLPERIGEEFPDLIPEENLFKITEVFRSSLLWRAQDYFTERTLELVRQLLGEDAILQVLLRVTTEPNNRFNAKYLHETLAPMAMALRDAEWSTHIAMEATEEDNPLWTLIDWAWNCGFDIIEEQRAELTGIILTWCLTTSNRSLRDRATKALGAVLALRSWLGVTLLDRFWSIDDDYLRERLLAAIYGAIMQGIMGEDGIREISLTTYTHLFAKGTPPVNCLIRDYGRGILEYALWRGCLPAEVDITNARPPYRSSWPLEIVLDEVIEGYKDTYGSGEFTDRIVSSSVNDGDFARYVIDNHVRHWSPAPIGTTKLPTDADIRRQWLSDFSTSASTEAITAYEILQSHAEMVAGQALWMKTPERENFDMAEQAFRTTLSAEAWEDYRSRNQRWMSSGMFERHRLRTAVFDLSWARRWVCKRAHDFGWSGELHGKFDASGIVSSGRMSHAIERVGKKYQWLALYELGARLADNCAFIGDRWGNDDPAQYDGESFGSLRNLDPSLLARKTNDDGWTRFTEATWWSPILPKLRPSAPLERLQWLYGDGDFINDPSCIDVIDRSGRRWLVLYCFSNAREWSRNEQGLERDSWARLSSLVVPKKNLQRLLDGISDRILIDPHDIPTISLYAGHSYLGEYPWHPTFAELPDWIQPGEGLACLPMAIRPNVSEYLCERGTFDYSIDETIHVHMPAPWLINALDLHLSDGNRVNYVNRDNVMRFFDPAMDEKGPHAALIDCETILAMLDHMDLAAVWVIAGEKGVYSGMSTNDAFGGRRVFTSLYWMENKKWNRLDHEEFEAPARKQVEVLLNGDVPSWVQVRADGTGRSRQN